MRPTKGERSSRIAYVVVLALVATAPMAGCKIREEKTAATAAKPAAERPPVGSARRADILPLVSPCRGPRPQDQLNQTAEERFGIRIERLMVTANGGMLDLRLRVVDPEKAAALLRRGTTALLIDEATGKELRIAAARRLGLLRQFSREPQAGRIYFILFANRERTIKPGAQVTVVIEDFRAEHLTVE